MMSDRFVGLSSKYDMYCASNSTIMPYIIIEELRTFAILQYETCNNKLEDYSVRGSGN